MVKYNCNYVSAVARVAVHVLRRYQINVQSELTHILGANSEQ